MKKFFIIFLCMLMFITASFAEETKVDKVEMTLEEAIEFALENNTSLIDLRKAEDDQKDLYDTEYKTYRKWKYKLENGGYAFEEPKDYLDCYGYSLELSKLTYDNFLLNQKGAKMKVEYTVTSLSYGIQELEDSIGLLEKNIEKQENDVEIGEVKLKLNMITLDELNSLKNTLSTSKIKLQETKELLDNMKVNLKQVMGFNMLDNLEIKLPKLEAFESENIDVLSVIEDSLATNISVISAKIIYGQKENNYILATKTGFLSSEEKKNAKKDFSDAEFRLNNEISLIKENLLMLYSKLKNSEESVHTAKEEFNLAKSKFNQAKIMYEVGLISKNSFMGYELSMLNSGSTYNSVLKEHFLLQKRWEIAINVGDIIEK